MNLLETVLYYQMLTIAVVRALEHFREHRWDEVRALDDLDVPFSRYSDARGGVGSIARQIMPRYR